MPLLRLEGLLRIGTARVGGGSDDGDKALLRAGGLARAVEAAVVDDAVEVRNCALLEPAGLAKAFDTSHELLVAVLCEHEVAAADEGVRSEGVRIPPALQLRNDIT